MDRFSFTGRLDYLAVDSLFLLFLSDICFSGLKEAYEEFKHVLLALIYDKDDKNSPVASEVFMTAVSFECSF